MEKEDEAPISSMNAGHLLMPDRLKSLEQLLSFTFLFVFIDAQK